MACTWRCLKFALACTPGDATTPVIRTSYYVSKHSAHSGLVFDALLLTFLMKVASGVVILRNSACGVPCLYLFITSCLTAATPCWCNVVTVLVFPWFLLTRITLKWVLKVSWCLIVIVFFSCRWSIFFYLLFCQQFVCEIDVNVYLFGLKDNTC